MGSDQLPGEVTYTRFPPAVYSFVLQIDPDTRPSNIGPPFTGHFRVVADTPRGLQPFQPSANIEVMPGKPHANTDRKLSEAVPAGSDLDAGVRRNTYESGGKDNTPANLNGGSDASGDSLQAKLKEPEKPVYCQSCSADCTRLRYHRVKSNPEPGTAKQAKAGKFSVCPTCFLENKLPETCEQSEFVRMPSSDSSPYPDKDKPWEDHEVLLLLEGLEVFDDSWDSVAEHVGTRTREQCILKFLQLEVEEKYLDAESTHAEDSKERIDSLAYLSGGRTPPFAQSDNPVMSVLGFLAGSVDPSVAAAASGQAVDAMVKSMNEKHQSLRQRFGEAKGDRTEDSESGPKESTDRSLVQATKAEDSMDIDDAPSGQEKPGRFNPEVASLAIAGARSSALASHTERRISSLLSTATSLELEKLKLKLQQFSEMESLLAAERRELEKRSRELFLERLTFRRRCDEVREGVLRGVKMGLNGEDSEGVKMVTDALKNLGLKPERLELKLNDRGDKNETGKGDQMEDDGGKQDGEGQDAVGDGWNESELNVDFKPLEPDDPDFRSFEI